MHDPDHVEGDVQRASDRVLTIPNALSAARLVGVPFFLWLVLNEYDAAAVIVLMVSGLTVAPAPLEMLKLRDAVGPSSTS